MTLGRMTPRRPPRPDTGFATVQFVVGVGLTLIAFTLIANVVVVHWGRGVVRTALDEGVRSGARVVEAAPACQQRAESALDDLLAGPLRAGVGPVACTADGRAVTAQATATFDGWLPGTGSWTTTMRASAAREPAGAPGP